MTDISTHTKLPWSIHSMGENDEPRSVHDGGWIFNQRYIGSGETIVADVNWNNNPRGGYPSASSNEEMLANAHLIVKAVNSHGPMWNAHDANRVDIDLLRQAIEAGDPASELLVRVGDIQNRIGEALATARGEA